MTLQLNYLVNFRLDNIGNYTQPAGGVRHGPQRVMGINITDVHFTLDTME